MPVDRLYFDGKSMIGYLDFMDLQNIYEVRLLKQIDKSDFSSEVLYVVGHRHLREARKIAWHLCHEQVKLLDIVKKDNFEEFHPEEGAYEFIGLYLVPQRFSAGALWVESLPEVNKAGTEYNRQKEKAIFDARDLPYDHTDHQVSEANDIKDLWTADHLTVYDYQVLNPYKFFELFQYYYTVNLVHSEGADHQENRGRLFAHHDLAVARESALEFFGEMVKTLENDYSPDVINRSDPGKGTGGVLAQQFLVFWSV